VAKEIKKYTNRYLASDFNLIELFATKEEDISKAIAVLLDPSGVHGQGSVFLEKFLNRLGVSTEGNLEKAIVRTEASIDTGRRIDILIEFADGFKVGIENKPWAGDQESQLKDYTDFLAKATGGNYKLIFLGGHRKEPSEWSIPREEKQALEQQGKLICKSYAEFLLPWLRECLKECEADKVRWFIRDFIAWIENNFSGGKSNEER
jgi:hypothetical protein